MDNSLKYPKTPFDIETCLKIIEIWWKLKLSSTTLQAIKDDLHFDQPPTYPDGEGNPLKDMAEVSFLSPRTMLQNT
jgi:hypothetical protein